MAFIRLALFPGATLAQYRALEAALADAPVPAQRWVFAAGITGDGLQVVQVWESREALDDFNERWLLPALTSLGAAGFPRPPVVTDFEDVGLQIQGDR